MRPASWRSSGVRRPPRPRARSDIAARRPLPHDVDAVERVTIPSSAYRRLARAPVGLGPGFRPVVGAFGPRGAWSRSPTLVGRLAFGTSYEMEEAMAVGLRLKFEGGTQEQYEAVHRHMNIEGDPRRA